MSKSKHSGAYDAAYFALVGAPERSFPITLDFGDERTAKAWRFNFYAFRTALLGEKDPRAGLAQKLQVRITPGSGTTTIEHIDNTAGSLAIQAAVMAAIMRTPLPDTPPLALLPVTTKPANPDSLGDVLANYYGAREGEEE